MAKSTLKGEEIIELFRTNENKAFELLYYDYKGLFISQIEKNNSAISKDEALDLFQDSLIILYDKLIKKEITDIKNVKSYLFRIGQLLTYQRLRSVKRSKELEHNLKFLDDINFEEYDFLSNQDYKKHKVDRYLKVLGRRCKELIILFYYKNLSLSEIVDLGVYKNKNTVKSQKHKCIKQLRLKMNEKF